MSRIGMALVGCGGMAQHVHLPSIRLLQNDYQLVAVCDRDAASADTIATVYGCKAYSDLGRMLGEEPAIAAVAVTVHAQHHHTVAIQALEAGKHVIVEKPMAITVPCADAMIEAARRNRVMIEVTENYPRMPMDAIINTLARQGILGELHTVEICDPVNGASLDIGVHRYAQLREAAGGWPVAIRAMCMPTSISHPEPDARWQEREFGDTRGTDWATAFVEFDNGVLGKCDHFPLLKNSVEWAPDLRRLVGSKGGCSDDLWPNVWPWHHHGRLSVKLWNDRKDYQEIPIRRLEEEICGHSFAVAVEIDSEPAVQWKNPVIDVLRGLTQEQFDAVPANNRVQTWPDWFTAELTAYYTFARAIRDGAPLEYGADKGRNDVELTHATYEAARTGQRLELPLRSITEHEKFVHSIFEDRYRTPIL